MEVAFPSSRHLSARPGKAPNGIAAPIWSKGWRIAAPATRRAMRWARNGQRAICRRRCRQLACLCDQRAVPRAGAVGCRCLVRLFARRLAPRSRHGARADGGGGQQSVLGPVKRRPRDRGLYGRRIGRADAGSQTPGRGRAGSRPNHLQSPLPQANAAGASIYAAACASCHASGRPLPYGGVNLALSTAIASPDPRNLANIVLSGVQAVEGERSPIMPGFAASMTDAQVSALLSYLRARFSNQPPWSGVEKTVQDARRAQTVFLQTSPAPRNAPADPQQRDKP